MTFPVNVRGLRPALLALSLISVPVAASAAPVTGARIGAPVDGEQLGGHPLAWAMAGLVAVVTGILIFTDGDDDQPVSP